MNKDKKKQAKKLRKCIEGFKDDFREKLNNFCVGLVCDGCPFWDCACPSFDFELFIDKLKKFEAGGKT